MPFLTEIKERINATQDTRKITQSLELVAASKMKGFVKKGLASRTYAGHLLETLMLLGSKIGSMPYTEEREEGLDIFVLVTSDKGLCGNLNQRLGKFLFSHPMWQSSTTRALVTIGKKGEDWAKKMGIDPLERFPAIGENMTPMTALKITSKIMKYWQEGKAKRIHIVSPHYINPFTSHISLTQYLPFSQKMIETHTMRHSRLENLTQNYDAPALLEPSKERVTEALALQIIEMLFVASFLELKASEYSSRMVAMKKASDAAGDMIQSLTLDFNKARQAQITNQLSELATAAEAMNT